MGVSFKKSGFGKKIKYKKFNVGAVFMYPKAVPEWHK